MLHVSWDSKCAMHLYVCVLYSDYLIELQGGVTPIDSLVTTATAVGQWSTVTTESMGVTPRGSPLEF